MGKPSKKPATKVDAAPALTPTSKKGKRGAEEALEKVVNAKKQKKDYGVEQAVQKEKIVAKTQKKKVESSESDDSSSEEEEKTKVVKKEVKAKKPPVKESSSGDDTSSDEEPPAKATAKNSSITAACKKNKPESSSSDSSDEEESDSSDEKPAAKRQQVANKSGSAAPKKATSNGSSEDSSDDESDEEEKRPANASGPKNVPAAATKKASSSDSDESDDASDEDEKTPSKASAPKKESVPATKKKAESSDSSEESDSDESDDEDKKKMDVEKDESEDDSSEDDTDDEAPKNEMINGTTKKASSSDEESSGEDESSDEDEESAKTAKKGNDVEMVGAVTPQKKAKQVDAKKDQPKTPATPDTGSKTIFVANLPYRIEQDDVANFFSEVGEVVDVRLSYDADQRFKGFGHVEFATAEAAQKAVEMENLTMGGRVLRLDLARERGDRGSYTTPYSGKDNSFKKGAGGEGKKVFVRGFDKSVGEDEVRSTLTEHFKDCGEIVKVSIPMDNETGAVKGMAYVEFTDADGFNNALELNESQIGDQYLTVEEARPRADNRDGGGWSGGRGGGRSGGRGGGRDSGGRFGGGRRGGGRGGRDGGRGGRGGRGGFNKPSVTNVATGKKKTFNDE